MPLLTQLLRQHRTLFTAMLLLTLLSGLFSIGLLSYINQRLLQAEGGDGVLLFFIGLLLLYLISSTLGQILLSTIGHRLVYQMQTRLLKQILDTPWMQIQQTGHAKILASLSNDIRTISIAFTRLPELLQGLLFAACCSLYILWLSPKLFAVVAVLMLLMTVSSHALVRGHYRHFHLMRRSEDNLYGHYQTGLDGHKELSLNRYRAERFFHEEFSNEAALKRDHHIRADVYHVFAVNWSNSVMLAAVGIIFYLAAYRNWASLNEAAIIAMTVLLMRGPLTVAIGALPAVLQSRIAVQALERLELSWAQPGFHDETALPADWQCIRLENVSYHYPSQAGQVFALHPTSLAIKRGETIFMIGANGSGKSTLCMLLAGLYTPASGKIWVDDIEINDHNRQAYRQLFASVFTDFHLFDQLMDGFGREVAEQWIADWLSYLQLAGKAKIEQGKLLNKRLSQGQKKRLALLLAAAEQRSILLLDEWAADQDPEFRALFYQELLPLLKQQGHTVFAISHDDKYFHHADRILSMNQGCLSEQTD
ncbi:multidrug ABC transporter permease/ATP-binding protein [Neisseria weixii]|uniref:multidrug ABC transporter permease/ATP-binding protein n=1 Tax=Neisseria weixii TaxID=1853276 RepID=UPI0035A19395